MDRVDCLVVGAGVVGLAVARRFAMAGREVIVVERHDLIGSETSSRNSEVIHAGIYYPAGSLKAKYCVSGKKALYEFCQAHNVSHRQCGKLIVAGREEQVQTIKGYQQQAAANGVHDLQWLSQAEINEREPNVQAVAGVWSPSTGIIDSHAYMLALQGDLEKHGGMVALNTEVQALRIQGEGICVQTNDFELEAEVVINSAGLSAPIFASATGLPTEQHFAKGHYYGYTGKAPFSSLVYPVAEVGGLGVHVTIDMAGQVKFGPDVRWIDQLDYSFDEQYFEDFLQAIRAYYPEVEPSRLHPSYTGIRPKIAPPEAGFQDFVLAGPEVHGVTGLMHLLAIESPGLTSSLAIADAVYQKIGEQ